MVNRMVLKGRIVADPELKHTESSVAYSECTIEWTQKYKDAETICFLRCRA